MFTKNWFFGLERRLRDAGLDSDAESFDTIKARLIRKEQLSPDEFARQAIYVVLAGGFSQKTAKTIHAKIMGALDNATAADLLKLFNNKNKINAVVKIWTNRDEYRKDYYALSDLSDKLDYLSKMPHIGKITANHLARNLGENVVKYDIWIQRLGAVFADANQTCKAQSAKCNLHDKINNQKLDADVRAACDEMFAHLERETALPRGFIDVVLWKACQNHLIDGI